MFKIIAVFVMTLFVRLYVRINILLTCETYTFMTACLDPTNYFILPFLIEVPVLSQESERSCISVRGVEFPLSTFFPIGY